MMIDTTNFNFFVYSLLIIYLPAGLFLDEFDTSVLLEEGKQNIFSGNDLIQILVVFM